METTTEDLYLVSAASAKLGISSSRIRQILRQYAGTDSPIGTKPGRDWLLSDSDINRIRQIPDKRLKDS